MFSSFVLGVAFCSVVGGGMYTTAAMLLSRVMMNDAPNRVSPDTPMSLFRSMYVQLRRTYLCLYSLSLVCSSCGMYGREESLIGLYVGICKYPLHNTYTYKLQITN